MSNSFFDINKEFKNLIKDVVKHENFKKMNKFIHHDKVSTKKHSLLVAYFSFIYAKKHKSKVDMPSLIRGALLHDYYLYDWHHKESWHRLHGFKHPYFAYKNAVRDFENINKIEKNIILRHMWPLTIIPPFYKEAWIVQYADKKATYEDYKARKKLKKK